MEMMSRSDLMPSSPYERIIVALDETDPDKCLSLIDTLGESVSCYKVGLILFASLGALPVIKHLQKLRKRIFCDLKVDDTPNSVEKAVAQWTEQNITLLTLRDNPATLRAAMKGRGTEQFPLLLSVPLLSTTNVQDIAFLLKQEEGQITESFLKEELKRRTQRLKEEGCDGFIASGPAIQWIREAHPDTLIVTPGIRPRSTTKDEHLRVATPAEALAYGADYLVIGRPIYQSENPLDAVEKIVDEIRKAPDNPNS